MTQSNPAHGPLILVLGATGQTGGKIADDLQRDSGGCRVRVVSRRAEQVDAWKQEGRDAVLMDLDDPATFPAALAGVDRLFLISGYTTDMLVQGKTMIDAAKLVGVRHIVHQGAFADPQTTDPHFVFHQLLEAYIERSGLAWTHLHTNYFMENLLGLMKLDNGVFPMYVGGRAVGWVALDDVAAVAARALREGPEKHSGKHYWLSADSLNGEQAAAALGEALGIDVRCENRDPAELGKMLDAFGVDRFYAGGVVEYMRQVADGRSGYAAHATADIDLLLGRPAITLTHWAGDHREALIGS